MNGVEVSSDLVMQCQACGKVAARRGFNQKYCETCSNDRSNAGYRTRSEATRRDGPATSKSVDERKRLEARGKINSAETTESIAWSPSSEINLWRQVRVAVPFSWNLSKNALWRNNGRGHVFMRKEAKSVRASLEQALRTSLVGQPPFKTGKVWIDVYVQKPNNRGDAVNVIDSVCDAIKAAIEVDDRYFSIRRLDWQITKVNPRIFVGVGQETDEEQFICTYCGIMQVVSERSPHKRTCKGCRYAKKPE